MPVAPNPHATLGPSGPCSPWVAGDALVCTEEAPDELRALVAEATTEVLWALSGRRFGLGCPVTLRPCLRSRCGPRHLWDRHAWGHQIHPCDRVGAVLDLEGVGLVEAVFIDGETFDDWTLDGGHRLRRTDGEAWPIGQDLDLAETEPGTFAVVVAYGTEVPSAGILAARELGCELLRLVTTTSGRCKLPRRTTSASRQGVTIEVSILAEFLAAGRTGLDMVDLFVSSTNPEGLASRSSVMSPDMPRHQRR